MNVEPISLAEKEGVAITGLHAFNIVGDSKRRKLNQFAVLYTFPDESTLKISAGGWVSMCKTRTRLGFHNANKIGK